MGGNLSKDPLIYVGSISCYCFCCCVICLLFLYLISKGLFGAQKEALQTLAPIGTSLASNPAALALLA